MEDITSEPCPHIATALEEGDPIFSKYRSVVSWDARRFQTAKNPAKRRKIASPTCDTCRITLTRAFACLHCSFAGCWPSGHARKHLKSTGHRFLVDSKSGKVFCSTCDDFIFNFDLEELYMNSICNAEARQTLFRMGKNRRESFKPWTPSAGDTAALAGVEAIPCQGRRGLVNLGQTCFLNVVLQSFVHNPLLRNYFLGDKHNSKQCSQDDCTCCEMDKLFSEVYSGDNTPYGPITFLATTWRKSIDLAGYAQQDAHEFFISALDHIHSNTRGHTNISCNCIVHTTFAGQLQSDLICDRCGHVNTTTDPILDISLELKGKSGDADNTLASCLRRYTQPEKLGSKDYNCTKCGKVPHDISKRLSISKLPPVLCFQFKRFEQKNNDKASARKLGAMIRFPAMLNMAPYTTYAVREEKENKIVSFSAMAPDMMYQYELFAVINHEGQMDNGHYTNFARFREEWYRFDDDKVTHTDLKTCLSSAAYMCFYVKKHLDYKPHTTPTYVLTRELEASKEKELEKEKELARMRDLDDALLAMV